MGTLQPLEVVVSETTPGDGERGKKTGTPTRTITFEDAKKALDHDLSIMRSVGRILYLTLYFALFINVLFTHIPTARMYEQASAVSSILATSGSDAITPSSPIKFFNIAQLSDVYDWLNNSFVPAVFVTQDQNGNELPSEDYARIGLFNKGLGGVLFQVYSKSIVDCTAEGSLLKLYPYCRQNEYYEYDSYMYDEYNITLLPFNLTATEASNKIAEWKEDNLIDNSTHRVIISVLTYNGELEGYVYTELTLHFQLGGFIKPELSARPTISIPYGKRSSYAADILVWIWWGMAVMWAFAGLYKFWKGEQRSSRQEWIVKLFYLFSVEAVVCVFYSIWANIVSLLNDEFLQVSLWKIADPKAIDIEEFDILIVIVYLMDIAGYTAALRVGGAIVIALIGLQILNRFRFHPQLNILTRTVGNALKQFAAFFVVFIVIFATFTIIGCMIFGDRAKEFSSLDNSMASCLNMLFGEFNFDSIRDLQFSVAFFWIYMIVVSIVLMNMMLGIVLDAYQEVSKASYNKTSNRDLANRIASMSWDMICELYLMLKPGAVLCHGKIRPRLLARALRKELGENPDASSTEFTMETLKSLFRDRDLQLTEKEFTATEKHIEQGITIVEALNSGDADIKKEN
ncbi:hypothetical protein V7S43_014993 [Phytophthora oleae]|uniref:Polycystin cation channel PKD1/PKD2 domain-containing protein n=1 Tax=Phytophthora oleae TaxID=2107226 RepID=A0ABD3F350_9STRA